MATNSNEIRTFALVGHGGAGKTSLAEAMLFLGKQTTRQGRIADRNTVSDFEEDERARGHSIDASLLHFPWKTRHFQVVDAPGYPDFAGKAIRSLDAVDLAVLVVNAHDGVALNTRRMFRAAGELGIPRVVVVNRCDMENIEVGRLGASIEEMAGKAAQLYNVPGAWGPGMKGVHSIFGEARAKLEKFVEAAVEADDALMEKYLESGEVSPEDLKKVIPLALRKGTLIPVFHTAAERGIGVPELLDFLAEFAPSPAERSVRDREGRTVPCGPNEPLRALCFKVAFDRQAGKVTFLRVLSGSMKAGDHAVLARSGADVKIGHVARFQGSHKADIDQGVAGDLVALTKLEEVEVGDTLHAPGHPFHAALATLPKPMVGLAVQPKARGEEAKLAKEIHRLTGGDPCLVAERSRETHELVIRGLSTLHLDIALKRMAHAGVEVVTSVPKIPYLETVNGRSEGHYRHKKQTGGAGQFGEVYLKLEPQERGSKDPLDFVDDTVGGSIPRQFLPAIEKGIRQKMGEGVIAGYPVVDVRVRVYDGKYHDVDSKEIAFIIAGRNAFADAFEKARPVLLEPMVHVEIEVPSRFMGDITGDLNTRRARIQGMDSAGDRQIIKALAPLAEMQTYSTQLRSVTAGEGSFTMDLAHYDVVPGNIQAQIAAKFAAEKEKTKKEE
jgi:elongation factor G